MRNRAVVWVLRFIGVALTMVGAGALAIAPLELICFRWFAEGGRFGYEGFGYGSFMFGNMAMQILGYYVIAAIAIPLGIGHLGLRRWVRLVMPALLRVWWVLGVPLLLGFLFILFASKEISPGVGISVAALAAFAYLALPWLLRALYNSESTQQMLVKGQPTATRVEALGVPGLTIAFFEIAGLVFLHVILLFGGLFPLITGWATGVPALALLDGAILLLILLLWGTLQRYRWAWWSALGYTAAMLILWPTTFARTSWSQLLDILVLPPAEMAILSGIPLRGWHMALLVALPLCGALAVMYHSYRQQC